MHELFTYGSEKDYVKCEISRLQVLAGLFTETF